MPSSPCANLSLAASCFSQAARKIGISVRPGSFCAMLAQSSPASCPSCSAPAPLATAAETVAVSSPAAIWMSVVSTLLSVTASIFNRGGVWREVANLDLPNNVPRWLSGRAARDFEVSVFETHRPAGRV